MKCPACGSERTWVCSRILTNRRPNFLNCHSGEVVQIYLGKQKNNERRMEMSVNVRKMIEAQRRYEGHNELIKMITVFRNQAFGLYNNNRISEADLWHDIIVVINKKIEELKTSRDSLEV